MTATVIPSTVPAVRVVRTRLHGLRKHRNPATLTQRISDLYTGALAVFIAGGLIAEALVKTFATAHPASPSYSTLDWLLVEVLVLACGLLLHLLSALGPVVASPQYHTVLLSTPLDRGALLAPRLWWASAVTAVVGVVAGLVVAIFVGASVSGAVGIAATVAGGAVTMLSAAVLLQSSANPRLAKILANTLVVVALAGFCVVVAVTHSGIPLPVISAPPVVPVTCAVVAVVPLLVGARRVLRRIPRSSLTPGFDLACAATAAAGMLDVSLLTGMVEERRWRRIGRVRSRVQRGTGFGALVVADFVRALRYRGAIVNWTGLLVVPYAIATVVPPAIVPAVQTLAATLAISRFAAGLRAVSRSGALRRALGLDDRAVRLAHLVVPIIASLLWTALTLPALTVVRPLSVLLVPVGAVVVTYRIATRPPMSYSGVMLTTPFGDFPPDLIRQLLRGPLLLSLIVALQLFLPF